VPELPEVEVTRTRIAPYLVGRRIRAVRTTGDSYLFLTPPAELRRRLAGRRIESLDRHGKYLTAAFEDGARLVIHLGMTGQLFCAAATSVRLLSVTARQALAPEEQRRFRPEAQTHFILFFEDGEP
jgi:formamidopyrimidine-DNA glycosylase